MPNITGWVEIFTAQNGINQSSHIRNSSGAFYLSDEVEHFTPWGDKIGDQKTHKKFAISLNRISSVYKNGTSTTQPKSLRVNSIVRT